MSKTEGWQRLSALLHRQILVLPRTAGEHLSGGEAVQEHHTHRYSHQRSFMQTTRTEQERYKWGSAGSARKAATRGLELFRRGVKYQQQIYKSNLKLGPFYMQEEVRGETMHEIKNIHIHTNTQVFTLLSLFSTRNKSEKGKVQPLFLKSLYLLQTQRSPTCGVDPGGQT